VKTANIATAKNNLSRLIELVKAGETIVITDRHRPVAQLSPLAGVETPLAALYGSGLLSPPRAPLEVEAFLAASRPALAAADSLAAAVLAEREAGR
jgi:prevent-host-death family protein